MPRILFAHPDEKFIQLYQPHLSQYFSFDSATDGLSAVRKIRLAQPSIIVSELHLPKLSGLGLLKFVRSSDALNRIPFLFLTDRGNPSDALGLGANDWLVCQDMTPQDVLDKVYYHLKINRV